MNNLTLFDAYEILPMYEDPDHKYCEPCSPDEAVFWTLFGHIPGEGVEAIADRTTRQDCVELLYRITGKTDSA